MVNREIDAADRWVDDRLAALVPAEEWTPNAGNALARLRQRSRTRTIAARRWIWTTVLAVGVSTTLFLIPASRACAEQPGPCVERMFERPTPSDGSASRPAASLPVPAPGAPPRNVAAVERTSRPIARTARNFKEKGSDSAPICVEIYLDYECPHCWTFVRDVAPLLTEQYVRAGKVKLLYRDYPLPTHRFARLAARYVDSAGQLGYFDAVMNQVFGTRQAWSETGDIDAQVSQVLPAGVMEKVRARVKNNPKLDDALSADMAAGQADHLDRTPFAVIVYEGKRQVIQGDLLSFDLLKSQLDGLLEK